MSRQKPRSSSCNGTNLRFAVVFAIAIGFLALTTCSTAVGLQDSALTNSTVEDGRVDFRRDILPIFQSHCFRCHGPNEQEGDLRLDDKRKVFGSGSGHLINVDNVEASRLYRRVAGLGDEDQMPIDDDPLSAEEIELIRRWIDEGADWPANLAVNEPTKHWAYVAPVRPNLPGVSDHQWAANPIDLFVLSKLEEQGLLPSPARISGPTPATRLLGFDGTATFGRAARCVFE